VTVDAISGSVGLWMVDFVGGGVEVIDLVKGGCKGLRE